MGLFCLAAAPARVWFRGANTAAAVVTVHRDYTEQGRKHREQNLRANPLHPTHGQVDILISSQLLLDQPDLPLAPRLDGVVAGVQLPRTSAHLCRKRADLHRQFALWKLQLYILSFTASRTRNCTYRRTYLRAHTAHDSKQGRNAVGTQWRDSDAPTR
jgi:hypothetical protein